MRANRAIPCRWFQPVLRVAMATALLPLSISASGFAQGSDKPPKVSEVPLTADQLAIYRAVLDDWAAGDRSVIYLSMLTEPIGNGDDLRGCSKKHVFAKPVPNLAHRLRETDLISLGTHEFRLVNPEEHSKQIEANDPENAIREGKGGKDLDQAVDNAIAHGLFTLGEIQFDVTHTYAQVSFGLRCGMLCGHGSTLLIKKTDQGWRRIKTCGGWVS